MSDYYNKLSEAYDALYMENITEFQRKQLEVRSKTDCFVDFYPSFGIKESEKTDFLICGQAVNGWGSEFKLSEKVGEKKLYESISVSNGYCKGKNHTPIDWVNVQWTNSIYHECCKDEFIRVFYPEEYRAFRSFFWNVTYKLICDYYNLPRNSFDWSKKLVWTNLYKIAPNGANPNELSREHQQPLSAELIKAEIQELNPRFCVMLTNLDWWLPFQKIIGTEIAEYDKSYDKIESVEYYLNTTIIVTNRPRFGRSDEWVEQILKLINTIDH